MGSSALTGPARPPRSGSCSACCAPTAGRDPLMEAAFRACITEERGRGRTVLLSSHILSEVEALCDRVTIIRRGRAVESGTLADLRHLTRTSISAELAAPPEGLDQLPGIHGLVVEGFRVRCEVDTDKLDGLLRILTAVGVRSLVSQPPTLEELFLRHYTGEEPERGVAQDTAGGPATGTHPPTARWRGTPGGPGRHRPLPGRVLYPPRFAG